MHRPQRKADYPVIPSYLFHKFTFIVDNHCGIHFKYLNVLKHFSQHIYFKMRKTSVIRATIYKSITGPYLKGQST